MVSKAVAAARAAADNVQPSADAEQPRKRPYITYGTVAANNGETLDVDVNGGTIEGIPMSVSCMNCKAGDRVSLMVDGPLVTALAIVSTACDAGQAPATKKDAEEIRESVDEVSKDAEQAKADAAAAKELTDTVSGKLDEAQKQLDAAQKSLDEVQAEAKQAKSDSETALAEARKTGQMAVTATAYEYAVSTSPTAAPATGWSADAPAHKDGEYTWMRVTLTYGDGRSETTEPVLLTGNSGEKGPQGEKGEKGDPGAPGKDGSAGPQGVSVASVTTFWCLAAAQPATPTGAADPSGWSTTEPEVPDGYSGSEWRCLRTVLSNGVAAWTVPSKCASFTYSHKAYVTARGAVNTANAAKSTAEEVSATLTRDYTPTADADKKYSTKAELSAKADEISTSVKETYATKTAVSAAQSTADAAKSAAGAAQSTADAAKSSAATANSAASSAASAAKAAQSTADTAKANAKTAQDGVDTLKSRVTTAETSIKQNSEQIALRATKTEVTSAVDSISIGGRNLAPNTEPIHKIVRGDTVVYTADILEPYVGKEIDSDGEEIVLSFDYKLDEGGISRSIKVYPYHDSGVSIKNSTAFTPTDEWQRIEFKTRVHRYHQGHYPNGAPYTRGEVFCYDFSGNNKYMIRRIKLELGNKPTDWSPAPEDLEADATSKANNAFTSAKTYTDAQIKVSADSITSTVSKTYATKSENALKANSADVESGYVLGCAQGKANVWCKLGTLTANVPAAAACIHVVTGNGYDGAASHNSELWITIKAGNFNPATVNGNNFGVTVKYGDNNASDIAVNVRSTAFNVCDVWIRLPWPYAIGSYSVSGGGNKTWANDGKTSQYEEPTSGTLQSIATESWATQSFTQSSIIQMSDSIKSSVEATYVSNDDAASFARRTELTQVSDSFTAKISTTQKQIDAHGETVRNVEDYMTFAQESGQPTLTIGTSSSKFNTKLTNTGQRFMNGTDTVMELDGPSSTVSAQRLKIGKYRLQQSEDGERLRIAYLG